MTTLLERTSPSSEFAAGPAAAPLRIIHLVSSLQVGGMEHFALRIAGQQRAEGHDARVLALRGGPLEELARQEGVPVRALGQANRFSRVARGLAYFALRRPQLVHAHNPTSLHYAVLAKLAAGSRVVMTYHGRGADDARVPSAREWGRTDAVVAVSAAAVEQIDTRPFRDRLEVIRNGVVPVPARRSRAEVRAELGLEQRAVGIITARVDGRKGHSTLLQALAQLRAEALPVTLLVVGDGAERPALEEEAARLGLDSAWLRFLGFRSDVPDLLAAADFFTLPSLTEGLPLSMLEAMTHSLPVIATPVGGIPEVIVHGEHGLLVPVGDAARLAGAIAQVGNDPMLRRRMGAAAERRAREQFSFTVMTDRYLQLYRRLLSRHRGGANR